MSKREEIRERRRRARTRQRLTTILIVAGVAIIFVGLLILPNLTPVEGIVMITPAARPMAERTAMGDPSAPVLVEVWEDFQCPACQRFNDTIKESLIQDYVEPGHVRYVFRQYPFIGRESLQAAHASLCAADQGRFWDYHDLLFANLTGENVGSFSNRRLEAYAETLGLNLDTFGSCFDQQVHADEIDRDFEEGAAKGVRGTPAVFVNGTQISPGFVPSYGQLSAAIEEEL